MKEILTADIIKEVTDDRLNKLTEIYISLCEWHIISAAKKGMKAVAVWVDYTVKDMVISKLEKAGYSVSYRADFRCIIRWE